MDALRLKEAGKTTTSTNTQAPVDTTGSSTLTPPDDATKGHGKSGPTSVTIHFEPKITLNAENATESVNEIQRQIDRLIADMANAITRPIR